MHNVYNYTWDWGWGELEVFYHMLRIRGIICSLEGKM